VSDNIEKHFETVIYIYIYIYIYLDSIVSYLPISHHLGFFRSWPFLYLPSSFSSVFLVLSSYLIFIFPCIMKQYTKMTEKMQLCRIIYYSLAALHVSNYIFAHHQEHLKCIAASDIRHVCRCRLVSWYHHRVPTLP